MIYIVGALVGAVTGALALLEIFRDDLPPLTAETEELR